MGFQDVIRFQDRWKPGTGDTELADRMETELHATDHECGDESGDHPCGGRGSPDGVCRHEDGSSHPCCQAQEPQLMIDLTRPK